MSKRFYRACTALIAVGLMLAGCSRTTVPDAGNEAASFVEEDTRAVGENTSTMEESETMESILRHLVDVNYDCITNLFYYGNLPNTVDGPKDVLARVTSDRFPTMDALLQFLHKTYVEEEVDRLMTDYFDGRPLYVENDGQLCVIADQTTSAGMVMPWKAYTVTIQERFENECSFIAHVDFEVSDMHQGENSADYFFQARKENGTWKLLKMVYQPV